MRKWLLAGVSLALVLAGVVVWLFERPGVSTVDKVDFDRPLAVPPLAASRVDASGRPAPDEDVGLRRHLPRPDPPGEAWRAGARQRAQHPG
jgi:hypothetical protein